MIVPDPSSTKPFYDTKPKFPQRGLGSEKALPPLPPLPKPRMNEQDTSKLRRPDAGKPADFEKDSTKLERPYDGFALEDFPVDFPFIDEGFETEQRQTSKPIKKVGKPKQFDDFSDPNFGEFGGPQTLDFPEFDISTGNDDEWMNQTAGETTPRGQPYGKQIQQPRGGCQSTERQ